MEFLWALLVSPFSSTMKPSMGILRQYAVVSWFLSIIASLEFFWEVLDVQFLVILSFSFQVLLILFTPYRKQTSNFIVHGLIWIMYLAADWVAILAATFIYKVLESTCEQGSEAQGELFAFWAQFLLLHLGGPDTITALALEDNELWLRTGLHLGTQAYAAMGVLVKSVQESSLWLPTILMFFAGFIKYLERASSLFNGRLTNSGEPLDQYSKLLSDHVPKDADVPLIISGASTSGAAERRKEVRLSGPSTSGATEWRTEVSLSVPSTGGESRVSNVEMVRDALYFFLDFKAHLYADQQYKPDERRNSRNYFLRRTPEEGFRVLEIQLNFSYDAFYTKMIVIHQTVWKVLRHFVMLCEVACLVIWCFSTKSGFEDYDIGITYTLLIGAIVMDVYSSLKIWLSIWSIASVKEGSLLMNRFYNMLICAQDNVWLRRTFPRRWSESVPQLNLINFCENKRSHTMERLITRLGIKDTLDRCKYVTEKGFSKHLRDLIFEYLRQSSSVMSPDDHFADYFCYAKGNWAILKMRIPPKLFKHMNETLNRVSEYDTILLHWHFITENCYRYEINSSGDERNDVSNKAKYREISKTLSDYMMYLFVQHPTMMSTVTGKSTKRIQEACDGHELEVRLRSECLEDSQRERTREGKDAQPKEACCNIRELLISELEVLENLKIEKWELVANVWVELLCYAAIRCRPNFHAVQLKQGGELLSFVWLLMAQFGFRLSETADFGGSEVDTLLKDESTKGVSARIRYLPAHINGNT